MECKSQNTFMNLSVTGIEPVFLRLIIAYWNYVKILVSPKYVTQCERKISN